MLRNAVLAIALAVMLAGIGLLAAGMKHGAGFAVGGGIFSLLVIGERWRYARRGHTAPSVRYEKTAERYRDPLTGRLIEVEFDRASGARRYVEVGAGHGSPENRSVSHEPP